MKILHLADLFCGAGGTSAGAVEAIEMLGYHARLTAINHWPVAIATHTENHPGARHLCTSIDDVNPGNLYAEGELDLLWASPECTHHSVARGGKPINDQSRATAWCVVRWAQQLMPRVILVENVPEFESWGGIGANGRPLKNKKGETFLAWKAALQSLGYRVEHRILCAADYGDPTTRRRLFVQAVRGRRKIVWPEPTHAPIAGSDLFGARRKWVPAREIIDWTIPGQSIYERKRPLSPKTMKRIMAGLRKFGLKPFVATTSHSNSGKKNAANWNVSDIEGPLGSVTSAQEKALVEPFILSAGGPECSARPVSEPVGTVLTRDHRALVEPFIIPQNSSNAPRSVEEPAPTVTTTSRGVGLVEPFLVNMKGKSDAADIDQPAPTLTAHSPHMYVAEPFLAKLRGTNDAADIDQPCPTVTGSGGNIAVVEPYLVETAHSGDRPAKSVDDPLPAVCGNRGDVALCEPFLVNAAHGNGDEKNGDNRRARSVDSTLPAVTGSNEWAVCEPFVLPQQSNPTPKGIDEPMGAIVAEGSGPKLVTPMLLPQQSDGSLRPVDQPAPTVATAGAIGLVEPFVVAIDHGSADQVRAVDAPLSTISTKARHAVAEPFLIEYYGQGGAESIEEPLNTVTTKERFALIRPTVEIQGQRYLLDIRFRMLQPHELAGAQGFPKGYKFTGTKTDQVKQIGNAVPRNLARALVLAALSQQSDISSFLEERSAA